LAISSVARNPPARQKDRVYLERWESYLKRAPEAALLPREPSPGAPVFAEPWHAEVLGIANSP